jgi:Cu/Ag efflux protein CusF
MKLLTNVIVIIALLCSTLAFTQDQPQWGQGGRRANQPHAAGTITAIRADAIDLQSGDGKTVTVKITSSTQFRKARDAAKLSDFKVGDTVFAVGEQQKDGPLTATMVMLGGPMGSGRSLGGNFSPEDLGKKFITGQVQKIEETKLTILRPDSVQQVIEANENTSFVNAKGESITLLDIKIGDRVGGPGELKNGTFVPQSLRIFPPRPAGRENSGQPTPGDAK